MGGDDTRGDDTGDSDRGHEDSTGQPRELTRRVCHRDTRAVNARGLVPRICPSHCSQWANDRPFLLHPQLQLANHGALITPSRISCLSSVQFPSHPFHPRISSLSGTVICPPPSGCRPPSSDDDPHQSWVTRAARSRSRSPTHRRPYPRVAARPPVSMRRILSLRMSRCL